MAKSTISILCPSGHRRKAQMMPNSSLLEVLEDVCEQENLDSSDWGLIHQRTKCNLTNPWRLQSIPTNATLEMYKLENRRATNDINVQLELPDNSRYPGWFEPTVTLQEMLDLYRIQPDSMVAAMDISMSGNRNSCPVCSYVTEEIIGEYALSNTTLRDIGLTNGTAVIRYNLRPVSDAELQKINARIDEKIVRRRQQQYEQEKKAKQPQPQPQATTKSEPIRSSPPSISTTSRSLTNSAVPSSNNEEYSIFRDPPVKITPPTTARSLQQSKTLAEELGLNVSLDLESEVKQRAKAQDDFRNFKFPAATKGKELYRNEFDDDYRHAQDVRPCDRRPIAYDITKNPATRENRNKKSEDLPDNFFETTADDLRSVLNGLQKQSSHDTPLETSSMRERAQSSRSITYEQIAIRFVVNKRYILQGLFRPEEPVSRLIDFAQATLICPQIGQTDFYLYTTPPRVVLSDWRRPLSTYDLAPAAFVHLGHKIVSPLHIEVASNIPIRTIDEANKLAAQYVFSRTRPSNDRERVRSALYNERPTTAASLTSRPTPRNPTNSNIDDKALRDKFRKFLPGKK
ncbi:unnamed protein product [Rotaria socialis]|uniref:TUG ubiquitin-like domain-containing protein n=1 Tax=Rotaria socialis TaxID=392032 RepID=A0A818VIG7_9BILA|nr:unnamed protein product [Rotaria socialis]CAF4682576.1 unnamed protein product [Rotaria socialis]